MVFGLVSCLAPGRRICCELLAVLLLCLGAAVNVCAQIPSESITIGYDQAIGLAAKWILEKQYGPARQILVELEKAYPHDPQVLFLRGQLAFEEREYQEAIEIYRRMLSGNPSLTRVRLELARALFAAGDFAAARYHFEIALGQTLDAQVRENVYAFLRAIQGRTSWLRFSAVFGVDSNPGYATDARTVDIGGLSFVLNPNARAKKSFGTDVTAQCQYAFGEDNRNFVGGAVEYRNYAGTYADYRALELTLGRSLVVGQALWTVEVGPLLADYQDKQLYHGAIVRLTNARPLGEHLLANAYVSLKRLEYPDYSYLTGTQYWVGTTLRYGLDSTSAVWTSVSLGRNLARDSPYSYSSVGGTLGYSKELPARFNVQTQVSAYRNVYDEPDPLFGADRRDRLLHIDLVITARDWTFHGFAPTLTLSAAHNDSTIPLYSFSRRFGGFGLTREF